MDIRVLRYFLAVAREESFSRAAQVLYLSQPTLSRQIRDMEQELGVPLFIRTNRNVVLTKEGMRLRKRAQEIVDLMDRTQEEFAAPADDVSGEIFIGGGETHVMRRVAQVATQLQQDYPGIRYHLFSGSAADVSERLDKGLLDFGIVIEPADIQKYDSVRIPGSDTWGLLMPGGHPLSERESIRAEDLVKVPLLASRQNLGSARLPGWLGRCLEHCNIVASYNLIFNAAIMVEEGMGCALCLDKLVDSASRPELCFRPLSPRLDVGLDLIWKKYQILSPAAELFLQRAQEAFSEAP